MRRLTVGLLGLGLLVGAARWAAGRWSAVTVSGDSMSPALSDGDRVWVRRSSLPRLRVGDIVVARVPGIARTHEPGPRDRVWLIKRVAALPGDPVPQPVSAAVSGDKRVPPGHLILLSDNAADAVDSRQFGYVAHELVLGRVVRSRQQWFTLASADPSR
ncbi:signal peptidase I [Kibdelosporangium banguiense]|uniref:Signal peptidase I n=1 Tax=Kibdelosporangium banguiense TaxID=1365924 RepID=A0ABS4TUE8_9PSEU|nr:S26 family signal peptidase [Kibdelosporangium banguiense]MBP2327579.1 signal peptidase I [Kibdelosporangium banguiense]